MSAPSGGILHVSFVIPVTVLWVIGPGVVLQVVFAFIGAHLSRRNPRRQRTLRRIGYGVLCFGGVALALSVRIHTGV